MIGLISNQGSGHNRDQFQRLAQQLDALPGVEHIVTHSAEDIGPALASLRASQCEYLAINGGDGTVAAVLGYALEHEIFPQLPPVLILPGGTANMTAGDVGISGKLSRAVDKFCRWHSGDLPGTSVERVMMRVQLSAGSAPHYGMFLGAGAVIQGTEYAHREIHSRGLRDDFSGALGVLRTVWGLVRGEPEFSSTVGIQVSIPELQLHSQHQAWILAVSSLRRLFLGMDPFWGEGPGGIRISIIEGKCSQFLRTFQSIARGKANKLATPENGYFSYNSNEIHLLMDAALNLDGEILTSSSAAGPVKISTSKPVTFIQL